MSQEHKRPKNYYTDPKWRKYVAPVVPPPWVKNKVMESGEPVEWNNTMRYSLCPCCEWPMRYLTEYSCKRVVTRLLPGSVEPSPGWLRIENAQNPWIGETDHEDAATLIRLGIAGPCKKCNRPIRLGHMLKGLCPDCRHTNQTS